MSMTYKRNDFRRLRHKPVRKLLAVFDQVADIDVAVILLE